MTTMVLCLSTCFRVTRDVVQARFHANRVALPTALALALGARELVVGPLTVRTWVTDVGRLHARSIHCGEMAHDPLGIFHVVHSSLRRPDEDSFAIGLSTPRPRDRAASPKSVVARPTSR